MKERQQFRAWLLKYVPAVTADTFVVIGVLAENDAGTFAKTKFLGDWSRVLAMDASADVDYLDALQREVELAWTDLAERRRLLKLMEGSFSNTIQISTAIALSTLDSQREFDDLAAANLRTTW